MIIYVNVIMIISNNEIKYIYIHKCCNILNTLLFSRTSNLKKNYPELQIFNKISSSREIQIANIYGCSRELQIF